MQKVMQQTNTPDTQPSSRRTLTDSYGRSIRKIRVSLTDVCNFRCFYCMPKRSTFMTPKHYLSPKEIHGILHHLCQYGVNELRLTGGEPTLRREFREIIEALSELPMRKYAITSNGFRLAEHLDFLKSTPFRHLNISLDSLQAEKFNTITRRKSFDQVWQSILLAKELGFSVKINTVLLGGTNDDEILDFVYFSAKYGIEVRFLEAMKIGQLAHHHQKTFIPASSVIKKLEQHHTLKPISQPRDSTSFSFLLNNGAKIGFIASESKPFCGNCSRWRLSADGYLRACLMSKQGINLKGVDEQDYELLFRSLLPMKPNYRIEKIEQDMNFIGG